MAVLGHANFRSQEYRPSRPSNSIAFWCGGSGAAAAVAAELANWTSGQLTSVSVNVGGSGTQNAPYVEGSRTTVSCYVVGGTTGRVYRVRFRNVGPNTVPSDILQLLTGQAGTGVPAIAALGSPPMIPGTTEQIVSVTGIRFNELS